jgi:endoglucanase
MFQHGLNIIILLVTLIFNSNPLPPTKPIELGVLSSEVSQYDLENNDIDHHFGVWGNVDKAKNIAHIDEFNKSNQRRIAKYNKPKTSLLTVEPWPMFKEDTRKGLLMNIAQGKYKTIIQDFCKIMDKIDSKKIIVRWGHEMELNESSRYPWSYNEPDLYVNAYRKWVESCREVTSKVAYNWSPAGNVGQEKYYPGDKFVDTVGMSWYSYPEYEKASYNSILTFKQIMDDKYGRVSRFGKPIIAAEFGMAGTLEQKNEILRPLSDLKAVKAKYPLLDGIVLFSTKSESWIPGKIGDPDWRLTDQQISKIK